MADEQKPKDLNIGITELHSAITALHDKLEKIGPRICNECSCGPCACYQATHFCLPCHAPCLPCYVLCVVCQQPCYQCGPQPQCAQPLCQPCYQCSAAQCSAAQCIQPFCTPCSVRCVTCTNCSSGNVCCTPCAGS